jgi:hypothetical protein
MHLFIDKNHPGMSEDQKGITISRLLIMFKPINFRWDSTGGAFRFSLKYSTTALRDQAIKEF